MRSERGSGKEVRAEIDMTSLSLSLSEYAGVEVEESWEE